MAKKVGASKGKGWRVAGIVGGAVALGVGAAIAAERAVVVRDRRRLDPYKDEGYGELHGRSIGPVASFDGTLLNVEDAGRGPTLVLSHGFSLNLRLWHHQIKDLTADHRLVLYDHRGHGGSGMPPGDDFSLDALARDLHAVIRDAAPDERVVLVGHSMGGMAVLAYAGLFSKQIGEQVAGLVLVDTTAADVMDGILPYGIGRRAQAAFQAVQEGLFAALAGRPDRIDRLRSSGGDLHYVATRLMGFGPDPSPAQVSFVDRMLSEASSYVWMKIVPEILALDVRDVLPAIDVPVMVIVGARDRLTPPGSAARIVEVISDAELVRLHDIGHTPMLEAHDAFNAHLRRFTARALAHQDVR